MMMVLDVGCGIRPKGNVNVDLYIVKASHRSQVINPRKIRNFILADGQHLPFKSNSFGIVVSYHTIEHVENPTLFLKECIRVAKKRVNIVCPHAWARSKLFQIGQGKEHKSYFRPRWFNQTLKNYYTHIKTTTQPLFRIPFLNWFSEIHLTIYLNKT